MDNENRDTLKFLELEMILVETKKDIEDLLNN